MGQSISVMVEGGKATAAPPLGPALGPLGINMGKVIEDINKATADMKGMQVPVKVSVDDKKKVTIEVGKPPTSALIKKEIGIQSGSGQAGLVRAGDLTEEQVRKIARIRFGSDNPAAFSQVVGSARSMGVTVGKGALSEEEKKQAKASTVKAKEAPKPAEAPAEAAEKPEEKAAKEKPREKPREKKGK